MRCMLKYRPMLIGLCLLLPFTAYSYLSNGFDARVLAKRASIVCKVAVLSLEEAGLYVDERFEPPLRTTTMVARVKCLATVKGSPATLFDIAYPKATPRVGYTQLATGEVCIVFLVETNGMARFIDVHNGTMPCTAEVVPYDRGDEVKDRILCELLAFCRSSTGVSRLLGTEYLGQLRDVRAREMLDEQSQCADTALRGVALAALIEIGVAPSVDQLLSYLKQDPASFDYGASLSKYHTSAYTITDLSNGIMQALNESIKNERSYQDAGASGSSAKLNNFDYLSFFDKALELPLLQQEAMMRRAAASALRKLADERSIPILKRLLDDSSVDVRYYAVTALASIYKNEQFPSVDLFRTNEGAYIGHWKEMLK